MKKTSPDYQSTFGNTTDEALEIGARLNKSPSECMIETVFQKELDAQIQLFDALNHVDLAHTLVMIESGIIPEHIAPELLSALIELQKHPADFHPEPSKGDLYTNREIWLNERTDAGTWLGAGRARREAVTTAYVIKLRVELISLTEALIVLGQSIISRTNEYIAALMPDYTYLQKAQPTSFGHYLLGFIYPLLRDIERIRALYTRLNQCPAGCGSSNGSRLNQSRERISQLLGFVGIIHHARDAMWQADTQIEIVSILTIINVNLDRLAEDLQVFMTDEFSLLELDDSHARASKIMPQKKNPFALTHIRGMANTMIGKLASSAALGRTPSGQPDNRLILYGMVPKSIVETNNAVSLMDEIITLLKFNIPQGRARLDNSFAMATDLAEVLVLETGLSFREAHRLVGRLARNHLANGNFKQLSIIEIAKTAEVLLGKRIELTLTTLNDALNPEVAISARNQPGGAAVSAINAMMNECRKTLEIASNWNKQQQLRMEDTEIQLNQKIIDYLSCCTGE